MNWAKHFKYQTVETKNWTLWIDIRFLKQTRKRNRAHWRVGSTTIKKKKNEYSRVTEFSFKRERQCKWRISKKEKNKRVLKWPSKWIQSLYRALLRGGKNKSGQGHGFWFLSNRSFDRAPPFLPALLRN